jgi:D-glycero-D-manno-heptose 1,7-bisphosphate phosphatase
MNKAVFLDRDGVINIERGEYTYLPKDFMLNPNVIAAIKLLKENGYLVIVISNQGGIARGMYTHSNVMQLHEIFKDALHAANTEVDAFYYCPHYPENGKCLCRKPSALMLEKAIARFDIDPVQSYLIGDSSRDIDAAIKVGVEGILIQSNQDVLRLCKQIVNNECKI